MFKLNTFGWIYPDHTKVPSALGPRMSYPAKELTRACLDINDNIVYN